MKFSQFMRTWASNFITGFISILAGILLLSPLYMFWADGLILSFLGFLVLFWPVAFVLLDWGRSLSFKNKEEEK